MPLIDPAEALALASERDLGIDPAIWLRDALRTDELPAWRVLDNGGIERLAPASLARCSPEDIDLVAGTYQSPFWVC